MFERIAAHTSASFSASACGKGAKTLWKRFVRDDLNLTHVVAANGRLTTGTVSGTTVRAPSSAPSRSFRSMRPGRSSAGSAGSGASDDESTLLTIRQATVETEWRHSLQTDLVAVTHHETGATTLLQCPPGFIVQVGLPAGAYRISAVRLAYADDLNSAPLVGVAALTVAPFERLPEGWTGTDQLDQYIHTRPVGVSGPTLVDLLFLGRTEIPELPPTYGSLLSSTPLTPAAA